MTSLIDFQNLKSQALYSRELLKITFNGKYQSISANMVVRGSAKFFSRFGASSPSILRPCFTQMTFNGIKENGIKGNQIESTIKGIKLGC